MANTNAISQMTKVTSQVSTGKSKGKDSTSEDNFQGMLDKVSGTESNGTNTKETDSKETAGNGQGKTNTDSSASKGESEADTKTTLPLQVDLAALVIQSMVGDVSVEQSGTSGTVAGDQSVSAETTDILAVTLPTVETQVLQEHISTVPGMVKNSEVKPESEANFEMKSESMADFQTKSETKPEKAAETPVSTDTKAEGNTEGIKTLATGETAAKEQIKNPVSTAAKEASQSTTQPAASSDKVDTLAQTPQQQTGSQEQSQSVSAETLKDTNVVSEETSGVTTDVKKETEKMTATPEPVTVKSAPSQDAEVVKIKVAEPFKQVDNNLMNQISENVKDTVILGKDELVIQLTPENLGKISIKISMMDDGIKVVLNCDNLKTQSLLADKASGIGKIVEDSMNSPVTVEVKEDNYWNQQKNATDQHNNHSRQQEEEEKQSKEDTDVFIQQLRLGLGGQLTAS